MGSRHDDVFDPTQPTLTVTCGNTSRKHRSLNRDVVLVGSAQGCDISLDAIGVLPVHCVIIRYERGFMLRNCAGHGGTRLNGESVMEAPLHDADALQIGPFSFQVYIPASNMPPAETNEPASIDADQLRHLLRSRRHLARLALGLRQRMRGRENGPTPVGTDHLVAARLADVQQREATVNRQSREHEQRALELQESQRQMA
ncbi:MAG TPA: FHA domain-containing protein, partial [Gemmataceae bacterium]|nr:FHA domain-containing protein [Gemmataceae bacterium]